MIEPGDSNKKTGELIDEEEYYECIDEYGDKFIAMIGGDAIKELLENVDIDAGIREIRERIQNKIRVSDLRLLKRLEILEAI